MQERYLGRVEPGMDVCDLNGDKIGSVAHVYGHEMAQVTAGSTTPSASLPEMPRDNILEVKTGFLGLGRHLYVPLREIQDVTSGCVFLDKNKEDLEGSEWSTKPDYLDQLT